MNMTDNRQTEGIATDSEWTVVESKKTKHAERLASCVIGSLNRNAHGNGDVKGKRVRFVEGRMIISFSNFPIFKLLRSPSSHCITAPLSYWQVRTTSSGDTVVSSLNNTPVWVHF
jgi:hypothetical protein